MQNLKHSIPRKIVLIGASTGGPGQIEKIVNALPSLHSTSIVIAQHMAVGFMPSFAKRLQENHMNSITLAQNNDYLENGKIYVCCGATSINKNGSDYIFSQRKSPENAFNPDINTLFHSFIPYSNNFDILSVILTGIGHDGIDACKILGQNGSSCITESESSAIVDGMPSRARKEVKDIQVLDIAQIVDSIKEFCS
jgi:two-component system, chemotaxis family, protein-glutamate methylesterase/glutaminase